MKTALLAMTVASMLALSCSSSMAADASAPLLQQSTDVVPLNQDSPLARLHSAPRFTPIPNATPADQKHLNKAWWWFNGMQVGNICIIPGIGSCGILVSPVNAPCWCNGLAGFVG